ncbi:MAG: hypothetical protein KTR19_13370 [Hyphomicrobiales bacterium]|nr:hypothetical protein [Hyphomicrobiales bacterium]
MSNAISTERDGHRTPMRNGYRSQPGNNAERSGQQANRVHLEKTPGGLWKVRDQDDLRGGVFRDYRSAARFIKHEFQLAQPSLVIVQGGNANTNN